MKILKHTVAFRINSAMDTLKLQMQHAYVLLMLTAVELYQRKPNNLIVSNNRTPWDSFLRNVNRTLLF